MKGIGISLQNKKLFFIGIGGSGMCPLALLSYARGFTVAGYDQTLSKNTRILSEKSIKVYLKPEEVELTAATRVVISSAIGPEHPLLKEALSKGLSVIHRSDLLKELLSAAKYSLCV